VEVSAALTFFGVSEESEDSLVTGTKGSKRSKSGGEYEEEEERDDERAVVVE